MSLSCRSGEFAFADTGHLSTRPRAFGSGGGQAGFDGSSPVLWPRNRANRDGKQRRGVSTVPPRDQTFGDGR
jgi:hypothetical protein